MGEKKKQKEKEKGKEKYLQAANTSNKCARCNNGGCLCVYSTQIVSDGK